MAYAVLEKRLKSLPEDVLDKISDYIDFLEFNMSKNSVQQTKHKRTPGTLKGKFYMSPDFDAPLEDFKEYM